MKNTIKNTHSNPKYWFIHSFFLFNSLLLLSTYATHASAGITDFVKDELVGCKIFNYPDMTEKVKWHGDCVDGNISGSGVLMSINMEKKFICRHLVTGSKAGLVDGLVRSDCSNGIKMDNYFADGVLNGKGSITKPDGEKIDTEYDNGELIRMGDKTFAAASKTKGKGVFQNGQTNGQSVQTLASGEKRVGEFKDGEIIKGIVYYPNNQVSGKTQYEGEFKNGFPHGKGKFTYEMGTFYEGAFENGKFHGIGRLIRPDGDYLVGMFKEGNYVSGSGTEKETFDTRKAAQNQAERDRANEKKYNIRIIRIN